MKSISKKMSHADLLNIHRDTRQAATAASLSYVSDAEPGITRIATAKQQYAYFIGKNKVRDKATLDRIHKLAIPPSWTDVWICKAPNGHIQATGKDMKGRKQYRYHIRWNQLRNETKFHRLYEFGKILSRLRKRIRKDLSAKELTREKVLATAIDLMDKTYIRIGNNEYEKANGSYGLTTLKDKHVDIKKDHIEFSFTGKKGIEHRIKVRDRKLASIIKQCRDIPGKTLFQYYDESGTRHSIDSGMVNQYIREIAGNDFSAKDFRTWAGSLHAVEYFLQNIHEKTGAGKKEVLAMLDSVSKKLGNSRNICKKYYVHPALILLCEEEKLAAGLSKLVKKIGSVKSSSSEEILMWLLKKTG
jgi:DNA topoisomerase I